MSRRCVDRSVPVKMRWLAAWFCLCSPVVAQESLKPLHSPLVAIAAGENAGALPENPMDWVCKDSMKPATPAEIEKWRRENPNWGEKADLGMPPATIWNEEAKNKYDNALQTFLRNRDYAEKLGWKGDKNWRMTGPYVGQPGSGKSYGVHPAVRIYYSPEILEWLFADRPNQSPDDIPAGAMLVKEMRSIDASLGIVLNNEGCMEIPDDSLAPTSWAVMVRDPDRSRDGWYWAGFSAAPAKGNPPIVNRSAFTTHDFFNAAADGKIPTRNALWYPTGEIYTELPGGKTKIADIVYPYNGFGNYCVNCHASAQRMSTFSSLDNLVSGGILYKGFDMKTATKGQASASTAKGKHRHSPSAAGHKAAMPRAAKKKKAAPAADYYQSPFAEPLPEPTQAFLDFYDQLEPVSFAQAWETRFPAETYDHVFSGKDGPGQFLTSDQCIGCHDATYSNSATPNMMLETKTGELVNLSPYGEWRASPMGLAGRDPIFYAQLQSETNNLPELTECIENTCLHCHGVMGQRQFAQDTQGQPTGGCEDLFAVKPPSQVPFGAPFRRDMVKPWQEGQGADPKYAGLARDGISCAVCHHIAPDDLGQESSFTGNFVTGPGDEVYGPFANETIVPKPMEHALGVTPKYGEQIQGSDMCGSCHNILLPVFTNEGKRLPSTYEQTTHLEWTNSVFGQSGKDFQSCQDCHMPRTYHDVDDLSPTGSDGYADDGQPLAFEIANIESSEFAPTTHRLPDKDIKLTERDEYRRHALHGLNVFLNEMFQQFPMILGFRQIDYMTGSAPAQPLITGRNSMIEMARRQTAAVAVEELEKTADGKLRAVVKIVNKTGHYLPSGVGFRRVFLEFAVKDAKGKLLWASGRTNELGVIVNGLTDEPLKTEQPIAYPKSWQTHYTRITRGDQVQIYQELITDSDGNLTTSFLRRVTTQKDNRLRPRGFSPEFYKKSPSEYIRELGDLHGNVKNDPHYYDPKLTGSDQIEYLIDLPPDQLKAAANVEATLYNQSIPPFYLQERFRDANRGPKKKEDIQRLYYLTSHLNTKDLSFGSKKEAFLRDWKLKLASAARQVK